MKQLVWLLGAVLMCLLPLNRADAALRHISGFEVGSLEWDGSLRGGTLETGIIHAGNRSLKCDADNERAVNNSTQNLGGITEAYFRFYLYVEALPVGFAPVVFAIGDSGSGNKACQVWVNPGNGQVSLLPKFGTGITLGYVAVGQWHRIEGHVVCNPVTGIIEGRLDDDALVLGEDRDTGLGLGTYSLGFAGQGYGGVFYFDDFRLNDTVGLTNNTWAGPGTCHTLYPNADAIPNQWMPSVSGNHFDVVNDTLSSDYLVTTSNTLDGEDRWDVDNLSDRIPLTSVVTGLMGGAFGQGFGSGPGRDTLLRFRDDAGSTKDGVVHTWAVGFSSMRYPFTTAEQTWDAVPVPLTVDYVNGMRVSAIDHNSNAREIRWYSSWLTVETIEPTGR